MKSLRSFLAVSTVSVFLIFSGAEARAAPVTYQFTGTCFSGSSPGDCGYFDLSDGDPVFGSITLDGDRLSATEFATFLPTDPDLDFSFTFGNFSVDKSNLDPFLDIRVMLSDSSGLGIVFQNATRACVDAVFPCYVVQTGTESLTIYTTFGTASRSTEFGSLDAYTFGDWTIASSVPEPSATILLTLAFAGMVSRRRRARRLD